MVTILGGDAYPVKALSSLVEDMFSSVMKWLQLVESRKVAVVAFLAAQYI